MKRYVGLTDDPDRRCREHGNPSDWKEFGPFTSELKARYWEKEMIDQGYEGNTGGSGWHYGYTFTITPRTR